MNNDNFLIERDDIETAQNVCRYIDNPQSRNRAVANELASKLSFKYFQDIEVDIESGLHKIPEVAEDIEISDIYLKGNYVDVRIYFNENEILVPKTHFDLNIEPVAYMFIKLDEDLSSGSVTGFVFPENIDTETEYNGYYKVPEADLVSYYDIEARLSEIDDGEVSENFEKEVFEFLDGKFKNKAEFYNVLLKSKYAREVLTDAAGVKRLFKFVSFDDKDINTSAAETDTEQTLDITDSVNDDLTLVSESEPLDELFPADDNLSEEISIEGSEGDSLLLEAPLDESIEPIDMIDSDGSDLLSEEDSADIIDMEQADEQTSLLEEAESESLELDIDASDEQNDLSGDVLTEASDTDETFDSEDISAADDSTEDFEVIENNEDEIDEEAIDAISELNFSTEVTPSINTIEGENDDEVIEAEELDIDESSEDLAQEFDNEEAEEIDDNISEYKTAEVEEVEEAEEIDKTAGDSDNNEQIDTLFDASSNEIASPQKKKKGSPIVTLGLIALICAAGYYGYNKFYNPSDLPEQTIPSTQSIETSAAPQQKDTNEEPAMPVETVEAQETQKVSNEATTATIPAIEQNLDASIDVTNLSVNWEVPVSYTTNATAKRYFVRVGKIMQLNLKTELLLMSTPPITNKISLELEFNKDSNKFKVKGIIDSSGVASLDKVIRETAEKTLNMNLNMNMNIFNTLQGNPILVIKL